MRIFSHAPQDDVALRSEARAFATQLRGVLPSDAWLRSLTAERGVDFSAATLYESLLLHPIHGGFAAQIDSLAPPRKAGPGPDATLVVVPGLVWEDYPQLGSDGQLVMDVARRSGFTPCRVPVDGRGTSSNNARVIVSFLDRLETNDAWLLSLSKGSADLRYAMSGTFGEFPWGKVSGWINVCGSPNGSDLAARLTGSPWRRLGARAMCLASRIPFDAMLEISARHPLWSRPINFPNHFRAISVVGLPMRWHVSDTLSSRHRMLSPLGPNDGVVLCMNAFVSPGLIYPLWGHDHYFRGPGIVPLLYRLFAFLRTAAAPAEQEARRLAM
ncbi:MAG TPA: hypothetical protein VLB72_10515 [Burkholderiales bacterium]|nr:hypothetical protein [Burkholderiales bacterium]